MKRKKYDRVQLNLYPTLFQALFVSWKVVSFWKLNSRKVNSFPMFGSVMKISWKTLSNVWLCHENELKNNLLMFYFFQVY